MTQPAQGDHASECRGCDKCDREYENWLANQDKRNQDNQEEE